MLLLVSDTKTCSLIRTHAHADMANTHSPLSPSFLQAALFTWGWWSEPSSGEGCLTKWAADSASSFACPRTAFSPSCHLSSRDTASSSFAVSSRDLGESDKAEVILRPARMAGRHFKWFVKSQVKCNTTKSPSLAIGWSRYLNITQYTICP